MSRSPIDHLGQLAQRVRAGLAVRARGVATLCIDEWPSTPPTAQRSGPSSDWPSWLATATAGIDRPSRLDLVVGPTIAPVIGLSGGQASLSRADWMRVAQHRFGQMLDGRIEDYQVAVDGFGGRERLACAMPRQLVDAVLGLAGIGNVRGVSRQPALVAAVNAAGRCRDFHGEGWIVAATACSLHAAYVDAAGIRVAAPLAREHALDRQQPLQAHGSHGLAVTPAPGSFSTFVAREACLLGLPAPTAGIWVECGTGGKGAGRSGKADLPAGFSVVRLGDETLQLKFATAASLLAADA